MKLRPGTSFFEYAFELSTNQSISFCAEGTEILCLSGLIWITWAGGREKCLAQDQTLTIKNRCKICLQAFDHSKIRILRTPEENPGLRSGLADSAAGFGRLGNRALSFLSSITL